MPFSYTVQSKINRPRAEVWQHVIQMKNVNYELMPYARMTYPADKTALTVANVPLQTTLFTSVILLFGFIPIDLHYLRLDKIVEGEAFYENSTTLMHKYWKHTRTLTDTDGGTTVRDEVVFQPRIPLIGYLLLPLYKHIFEHRHKRLKAYFN